MKSAYFLHKSSGLNLRNLKGEGRYSQKRLPFDILLRVKSYDKLNTKLQRKLVAFIIDHYADDFTFLTHLQEKYGVPCFNGIK